MSECQLELLSLKSDINLDQILGKNVTVKLALQDDKTALLQRLRHAILAGRQRTAATAAITRSCIRGSGSCRGRPTAASSRTRPFQRSSSRSSANTRPRRSRTTLTGTYAKWTYCVQYRETDLNFVMPAAGARGYLLLLHARRREAHAGDGRLLQRPRAVSGEARSVHRSRRGRQARHRARERVEPDARDPARRLRARRLRSRAAERRAAGAEGGVAGLLTKQLRGLRLPGRLSPEVRRRSDRRRCASTSSPRSSRPRKGRPTSRSISVGSLFTSNAARAPIRTASTWWSSATYDLEYSDYEAMPERGGAEYRCSFVAMSSKQQFRPRRLTPKPFVQGPQTAVVVGPAGDEIYTDKYGRVKVLFHWDREGEKKKDENCFVLGPGVTAVGGQGLGRRGHPAHRPGGHRRLPRGRSRSADHHRAGLQRRADAAVRAAGEHDPVGHQEPQHQGRRARTTSTRSGSRT